MISRVWIRGHTIYVHLHRLFEGMVNFILSDVQGCDNRITEFIKNVCIPSIPPVKPPDQWTPFDHTGESSA